MPCTSPTSILPVQYSSRLRPSQQSPDALLARRGRRVAGRGAVASYPDSRQAVARWFGFDSLSVEVDPELLVPAAEGPSRLPDQASRTLSRLMVVRSRRRRSGRLNTAVVVKTVGSLDQIEEVTVQGRDGLCLRGATSSRVRVARRIDRGRGGLTDSFVWQNGAVLVRVEGFAESSDALAFVDRT